jgi:hypothetical protein
LGDPSGNDDGCDCEAPHLSFRQCNTCYNLRRCILLASISWQSLYLVFRLERETVELRREDVIDIETGLIDVAWINSYAKRKRIHRQIQWTRSTEQPLSKSTINIVFRGGDRKAKDHASGERLELRQGSRFNSALIGRDSKAAFLFGSRPNGRRYQTCRS